MDRLTSEDLINAPLKAIKPIEALARTVWPNATIEILNEWRHDDRIAMVVDPAEMPYDARMAYEIIRAMGNNHSGKTHTSRRANRVSVRIYSGDGRVYNDIIRDLPMEFNAKIDAIRSVVDHFVHIVPKEIT